MIALTEVCKAFLNKFAIQLERPFGVMCGAFIVVSKSTIMAWEPIIGSSTELPQLQLVRLSCCYNYNGLVLSKKFSTPENDGLGADLGDL